MKDVWLTLLGAAVSVAGCGAEGPASTPMTPAAQTAAEPDSRGVGVVQSVDVANRRITIAHEPIESLGWPSMTMGFAVTRPELLDDIATGQRVEFTLRGRDMSAVITSLTPTED